MSYATVRYSGVLVASIHMSPGKMPCTSLLAAGFGSSPYLWGIKGGAVDIGNQIRSRREAMGLSQEELAKRVYVSRNTIGNWETGRTYPDLQSLLLLGALFGTSLDALVKGDVNVMEERLAADRRRFKRWSGAMAVGLCMVIILAIPLSWHFGWLGLGAVVAILVATFVITCRVEHMNREELDLVTYEEILAFMEGREVERDAHARTPKGRREIAWRTFMVAVAFALMFFVIFYVICAALDMPRF